MTLKELEISTQRLRPKPLFVLPIRSVDVQKYTLNIDDGTLLISATVQGSGRSSYEVNLFFLKIDTNPIMIRDSIEIPLVQNQVKTTVLLKRLVESSTPCMVQCQCPDYNATFAAYNKTHDAHYGSLQQYTRKTTTHKPRNPQHILGICKHLQALVKALKRQNILRS